MASSDPSKSLKRKASSELSRLIDTAQSTLNTPSDGAIHKSDEQSPTGEQGGPSIDSLACSPLSEEKLDIAERAASYLERNTPRNIENGEPQTPQDEGQQLLREILSAYRNKRAHLSELEETAVQIVTEEKKVSEKLRQTLEEQEGIFLKCLQVLRESKPGSEEAKQILLQFQNVMNNIRDIAFDTPYALVLIDGDGYIFNEDLIRQGLKGGEIAAERLESRLHQYFSDSNFRRQRGWRVVVFIFASIDGLSHKMKKFGRIQEASCLRFFAIGINQSQALVNVVDVGAKCKEGTDYKIRAFFDLFGPDINSRCRHVVLGCSHDGGYLRMLAPYKHKASHKDSITLLETKSTADGFQHMPFKKVHFHDLLISSTILNTPPHRLRQSSAAVHQLVPASQTLAKQATTIPAIANPSSPHDQTASRDRTPSNHPTMIPTPPTTLQTHLYPRNIALNGSNQRVDIALPQPTTQIANIAAQKLKDYLQCCTETGTAKPCQEWHLAGTCAYGNSCALDHLVHLDNPQLEELARMARGRARPSGALCRDNSCVLGHSCPYDGNGNGKACAHPENCRLVQAHGMDMTIVEVWDPRGNVTKVRAIV